MPLSRLSLPLLAVLALSAAPAAAGTWTRVDRATVKFEGPLRDGEYGRFAAVFDGNVRELIVTSQGGDTEEGVRIGLALAAQDVKVTVVGECVSSCANYLFVGGHRREIRHGVVGFHGNITACNKGENRQRAIEEMRRQGVSDKDIQRNLERQDGFGRQEQRFLQIMGVDQALFDRTCTPDKGMHDGKGYTFLLPTRATFEKYRIYGVVGDQDAAVIKTLRYSVVVD